jgi:hypothetical protein
MPRTPMFDPIEYLVRRRFPNYAVLMALQLSHVGGSSRGGITQDQLNERMAPLNIFREELRAMSPEERNARLAAEQAKEKAEVIETANREEKARFFNRPDANADFSHWSKATYWTLDEAIALSFGKAPEVVNWEKVRPHAGVSPFARQYSRVRDLAQRAIAWKLLFDPVLPTIYLAWSRRNEIAVPEELIRLVESRGVVVGDWKTKYDELKGQFDMLLADRDKIAEGWKRLIAERDELRDQVAALKNSTWNGFQSKSPTYPSELDAAMQAWLAVSGNRDTSMTVKAQITDWVEPRFELSKEALLRIATVCNWEKYGGRRKLD